jgi:hypothetical protein
MGKEHAITQLPNGVEHDFEGVVVFLFELLQLPKRGCVAPMFVLIIII